jgi:hypothetical protein
MDDMDAKLLQIYPQFTMTFAQPGEVAKLQVPVAWEEVCLPEGEMWGLLWQSIYGISRLV